MEGNIKVYKKGIAVNNIEIDKVKELLSPFVGDKDDYSEFKIFRGIAYTNELDRDGEIGTHQYLEELAPKLVGVPVIKDHNWSNVDGVVGRVISAEVEADGDTEFIRIMFYAVKNEDIENIENGLYFGLSVGSSAKADGNTLVSCTDAYEVSLVVVPAVPGAHITKSKSKELGGKAMEELETLKAEIESLKNALAEAESENSELKNKLAEIEEQEFVEEADETLETKANELADEMDPTNDTVKEYIVEELKSAGYERVESEDGATQLKCGKFISLKNLTNKVEEVKTKYANLGLLGKKVEASNVEEVVVEKSAKENPTLKFTNDSNNNFRMTETRIKSTVKFN